jgi:hypothetical protein
VLPMDELSDIETALGLEVPELQHPVTPAYVTLAMPTLVLKLCGCDRSSELESAGLGDSEYAASEGEETRVRPLESAKLDQVDGQLEAPSKKPTVPEATVVLSF